MAKPSEAPAQGHAPRLSERVRLALFCVLVACGFVLMCALLLVAGPSR